jgi:hypothetical protein
MSEKAALAKERDRERERIYERDREKERESIWSQNMHAFCRTVHKMVME